ncbi:ABC-type amino acid transport/signal transduction systems, periplasmic component/domain [Candidatus Moduliflexus flocculans]|uniref:ABC-type amino acid transport/signal transduction systems, periplasmic component/domain n=1 Tax=Candidatus Moduliflexus flocculans TaxID=1499966 RepID=A0A0S6VXF4_9BACT|nr:ABC-type amino acid transport/signal transduction systems, periplasmic component/domain [Candidatus Moduliflexus flocculans]
MKYAKSMMLFFILLFFSGMPAWGQETRDVYLASLEWPPYVGETLPEQGAIAVVAREAFAAMGYTLHIEFFPWMRAIYTVKRDNMYAGYFPEYYAKGIEEEFLFSSPLGVSPLGFVERKDAPVVWQTLDDLKGLAIGTVNGYVNTEEFDRKAAAGELQVDTVMLDSSNILKVAAQRIQIAVIDRYVLEYLFQHDAEVSKVKDAVQFNAKILEEKQLFICFRRSPENEQLRTIFNEGLQKIDASQIMREYFQRLNNQ